MISMPTTIPIKSESNIVAALKVVPTNPLAGIALCNNSTKATIVLVAKTPEGPSARPVKRNVIQVAASVPVEGEGFIVCTLKVVATDAMAGIAFSDYRGEDAILVVTYHPERTSAGPV